MGEGISESEMEELVSEWGWRRDKGSCQIPKSKVSLL